MKDGKALREGGRAYLIAKAIKEQCDGGGFDEAWSFEDKGGYVKAQSWWHLMDDVGNYRGYYPFTVIIPKKRPADFRLYGKGGSRRVLEEGLVWGCIEEMLCFAISALEIKEGAV